eukprot:s736_g10.t1
MRFISSSDEPRFHSLNRLPRSLFHDSGVRAKLVADDAASEFYVGVLNFQSQVRTEISCGERRYSVTFRTCGRVGPERLR